MRQRSLRKTNRDNSVCGKQTRQLSSRKTKHDNSVCGKQNATTQFAENKTRQRSLRKTKRDNSVCENEMRQRSLRKTNRDNAVLKRTKRDNSVREKQNVTTQFAKNKTRQLSLRNSCAMLLPYPPVGSSREKTERGENRFPRAQREGNAILMGRC